MNAKPLTVMNFYQYLNKKGLLHLLDEPPEKIDELRKAYRKEYKKEYRKLYQKKRVHRVLIFSHEEFALLKRACKNHKLPFSTFVRESALKYLSNGFIVPDKAQTKHVLVALKRYGVLLNQIAYIVNAKKTVNPAHIEKVQKNFQALETDVKKIFTEPVLIEDFIREVIVKEPLYVDKIQSILNSFIS